ncbi:unnamed protein product [Caenorhabditis auriculariae]|uniref:BZIP domain-containing protein n=1 Tax=Caenorhabditis auriculariae TaxID=2777116 RepID=A0A8S1H4J6_9PELO|nr:unnamed protein product [Caenorhabditis auriculariae]
MSVVSTATTGTESTKKRVQIMDNPSPTYGLETPNPKLLFTPLVSDLPTTAELMQRCLHVNPFEAKFREANQRINNSSSLNAAVSSANSTLEAMEANGLVPMASGCLPTSATMTDLLLKLPPSTLQQSPGIFSNISILAATNDHEGITHENLKTADISKLLSAVSAAGDSAGQAPRTADVLNAVLDMHSDRLHTINYINKPDFSALMNPSSSAPNSASILSNAICAPSTSGGLLAPPSKTTPAHSPRDGAEARGQHNGHSLHHPQRSPAGSDVSSVSQSSVAAAAAHLASMNPNLLELAGIRGSNANFSDWDPRDVKPPVSKPSELGYFGEVGMNGGSLMQLDDFKPDRNRQCVGSSGSEREMTPTTSNGPTPTPGRGRGRGRSTTADMPPDERSSAQCRMTILERNKAAAVRYRKRKKEEHDDMIGRVQGLEQDKATLATQNQVLRRELERVTALLQEREQRCVCLKGMPLSDDNSSPLDILNPHRGMYMQDTQQLMINGLGLHNGMQMKRPKM